MSRKPFLFLSHAGADTAAALALKTRLENAPTAKEMGLRVWFDKTDLRPGEPWQEQLEKAINIDATAFAVYIGASGIVNWVDAEVRLGISRSVQLRSSFPFIPVIAAAADSSALPGFVRQYQAIKDIEGTPSAFTNLLSVVLGQNLSSNTRTEDRPFFGLRSIDEERNYLFFGRETETRQTVAKLAANPLLLIVGDSGSGKSSLVKAGLIPKWRGGALAEFEGHRSDDELWHVLDYRPGVDPNAALGEAVLRAANALGRSVQEQEAFVRWAVCDDLILKKQGLRCGLDGRKTRTLLFIDQFEEIVTSTRRDLRAPFVEFIQSLNQPGEETFSVVLTMRRDYYNLLSEKECRPLYERLEKDRRTSLYRLGRINDGGLYNVVTKPLELAGISREERDRFAEVVLADVGERPGDLALLQFALTRSWERRREFTSLTEAYGAIGGVDGALAGEADRVFEIVLGGSANEPEISATLIRLARLQGTAGPTRRIAMRREFTVARWSTLQKLADEKGNRLVLLGEGQPRDAAASMRSHEVAEIAHEALLTRWPRFHAWLSESAEDKRTLDRLTDDANAWAVFVEEQGGLLRDEPIEHLSAKYLARGHDLETFLTLRERHEVWLSTDELAYISASEALAKSDQRTRERLLQQAIQRRNLAAGIAVIACLIGLLACRYYLEAQANFFLATLTRSEEYLSREQPSRALALSTAALERAGLFSLAADYLGFGYSDQLTRARSLQKISSAAAINPEFVLKVNAAALSVAVDTQANLLVIGDQAGRISIIDPNQTQSSGRIISTPAAVRRVRISPASSTIIAGLDNGSLLQVDLGIPAGKLFCSHAGRVNDVVYNQLGTYIASAGDDGKFLLWPTNSMVPRTLLPEGQSGHKALSVSFSPNSLWMAGTDEDGRIALWSTANWNPQFVQTEAKDLISVDFSPDTTLLATASLNGTVELWTIPSLKPYGRLNSQDGKIWRLKFEPDGKSIAVAYWDGSIRLWSFSKNNDAALASFRLLATADGNDAWINDVIKYPATRNGNEKILSASEDGTVKLWDFSSAHPIVDRLHDNDREVLGGGFTADGRYFVSGARDGLARVYKLLANGMIPGSPTCVVSHAGWVDQLAFSHDGQNIVTTDVRDSPPNVVVRVWKPNQCEVQEEFNVGRQIVTSVAAGPERSFAYGTKDGKVVIKPGLSEIVPELVIPGVLATSLEFSPDARSLGIGADDGRVYIVNLKNFTKVEIAKHQLQVLGLRFSPDGRLLTSVSETPDEHLLVSDIVSGALQADLILHGGAGTPSFSRDGSSLAAGGDSGFLAVWSTRTWEKKFELDRFVGVRGVFGFHPITGDLAFDGGNGELHFLRAPLNSDKTKTSSGRVNGIDVSFKEVGNVAASNAISISLAPCHSQASPPE